MDSLREMLDALPRPPPRSTWSGQRWLLAAVMLALVASLGILWTWSQHAEERAIQAMPDAERAALYRRTLDDLASVCVLGRGRDLEGHCRDQARFILQFADCDAACERLARRQLPGATR